MKNKLLRQFIFMSKLAFISVFLQCLFITILLAGNGKAQVIKPVSEVACNLGFYNETLSEVFQTIERKTNFKFSFFEDLNLKQRVTISKRQQKLRELLLKISEMSNLSFKQVNNVISVSVRKKGERDVIEQIIQFKTITGKVTSADHQGLPGVNVIVKGISQGTVTDVNGNYKIEVPSTEAILVFSSVGFITEEVSVGNQTVIDIVLAPDITSLEEIVVVSFGIRKTKQELTYSTQEVEGEDIAKVGNPNVLNGLQGKVAGVSVSLTSGMPGRSPLVRIRGSRSFTGNNQPLYVIDGAPVAGRAEDLNPSDIASVNILKGPAASALYGLRASNGVVMITTKTGKAKDGPATVSFDTFYSIDRVGMLPDLQRVYAQGSNGSFSTTSPFSWGPKISELGSYTNEFGEEEIARSYNNDEDFYQTGGTSNTNLSISNSGEIGSYYIGIGHNRQEGIVPGTDLKRTNLKFNGSYNFSQKFTASLSVNFLDLNVDDYPDLTGNTNYFRSLTDVPPSYNLAGKPFAFENDPYRQRYFRASQNNPYWVVNHNYRNTKTPRTFGNISLDYQLNDHISFNYRLGIDYFNTSSVDFRDLGTGPQGRTNPPSGGNLILSNNTSNQINSNLFVSYKKQIKEVISLDLVLGNEVFDQRINTTTTRGENFVTGGWANLNNATVVRASNSENNQRIVGFYGNMNVGWQDKIFLNASGRNDFVSNMPSRNRSFFYPSIGVSMILTETIPGLDRFLSFGKLRATFAEVGQAGPLYVNGTGFVGSNPGGFIFPFNGLASFTQNSIRINPDLKPENTESFELGLDFRFLDDRIGIDYTYYTSTSNGQIFNVPLAFSTGATSEIRNAGEMSSNGHEIVLTLVPIRTSKVSWNVVTNFSTMENKVVELAEGINRISINSGIIVAEKGYDYPSILGRAYFKDPESGKIVVQSDPSVAGYGMPITDPEFRVIGSPIPDFEMNFINNFSYKNLSLSFQIDWRSGGQLFSNSYTETRWRGAGSVTLNRDEDVILDAKKGFIDEGGLVIEGDNDIPINQDFTYYSVIGQWRATEQSLQDASFVRLREVVINYDLPDHLLKNMFIRSASVYLTGRNLFLMTDSFTDPEVIHSDNRSQNTAGLEWSQIPQTKSIGAGIRVKF